MFVRDSKGGDARAKRTSKRRAGRRFSCEVRTRKPSAKLRECLGFDERSEEQSLATRDRIPVGPTCREAR